MQIQTKYTPFCLTIEVTTAYQPTKLVINCQDALVIVSPY
jgi:hypothetical protein